eukprot:TRINITY_DN3253_c0_g2_i3.p1 TRINITY_DN3253_c0_g2~~TRINITY_DN3253_c0_g2_i3.p1  ORF type:complete len:245 (-),score=-8.09 TRINITY_DN3253_c0_g2_i3:244-978(-)
MCVFQLHFLKVCKRVGNIGIPPNLYFPQILDILLQTYTQKTKQQQKLLLGSLTSFLYFSHLYPISLCIFHLPFLRQPLVLSFSQLTYVQGENFHVVVFFTSYFLGCSYIVFLNIIKFYKMHEKYEGLCVLGLLNVCQILYGPFQFSLLLGVQTDKALQTCFYRICHILRTYCVFYFLEPIVYNLLFIIVTVRIIYCCHICHNYRMQNFFKGDDGNIQNRVQNREYQPSFLSRLCNFMGVLLLRF